MTPFCIRSACPALPAWAAGALLGLAACLLVACTTKDYGITWDEPLYFRAGRQITGWMAHPRLQTIDALWKFNHEHPPLVKMMGGLGCRLFTGPRVDAVTAFRLGTLPFVWLMTFCLYTLTRRHFGGASALWAVLAFWACPRVFFHAHLGAFDFPCAALGLAAVAAAMNGREKPAWFAASVLCTGLALLTKINAVLLFVPLGILTAVHARSADAPRRGARMLLGRLAALGLGSGLVFLAGWPWLWLHPVERLQNYVAFFHHHKTNPTFYFGALCDNPPWHYGWTMLLLTTPLVVLVPALLEGCATLRAAWRRPGALPPAADAGKSRVRLWLLFNALLPIGFLSLPGMARFDDVRQFLPAFPFIAMLAGAGIGRLRALPSGTLWMAGAAALFLLTAGVPAARMHPFQFAYYNELAGGTRGAERAGFEVESWHSSYRQALPWINAHPDRSFSVYAAGWGVFDLYREAGLLDPRVRVRYRIDESCDYLVVLNRRGFIERTDRPNAKRFWDGGRPVHAVEWAGTPMVRIYPLKPGG